MTMSIKSVHRKFIHNIHSRFAQWKCALTHSTIQHLGLRIHALSKNQYLIEKYPPAQ